MDTYFDYFSLKAEIIWEKMKGRQENSLLGLGTNSIILSISHSPLSYIFNHNEITNSRKVINYESQPIPKCIVSIPMKKKKIEMHHSSM